MDLISDLSSIEFCFLALFVLIYILYFLKVKNVQKSISSQLKNFELKLVLRTSILVLLIISILGPEIGSNGATNKLKSNNIYFAIDVSQSMLVKDIDPSRLELLKFELIKIISDLKSSKIGLIAFSEDAFLEVPLTHDHTRVKEELKNLNPDNYLPLKGTVLFSPLKLLATKYSSIDNNPIINLVVFTDGEDYGIENKAIINELNSAGVLVNFVGVGSTEGGIVTKIKGKQIISRLNNSSLISLSESFNSNYYELSKTKNEMLQLKDNLLLPRNIVSNSKKQFSANNIYYYFLILAILFILVDLFWVINIIKF